MNNENKIRTGLWTKESKQGKKYMSGRIELEGKKYSIAIFRSDKRNDKSPDYTLYLEEYKPQEKPNSVSNEPSSVEDAYAIFAEENTKELESFELPF